MVNNLAYALKQLTGFKNEPGSPYTVEVVDGVQTITAWDEATLGPQPTQAEIEAAYVEWEASADKRNAEKMLKERDENGVDIRVIEDIYDTLVVAGIVTDAHVEAALGVTGASAMKARLAERKNLRSKL